MNRRTHPKIRASIYINLTTGSQKPEGVILVKLENVGGILARHVMVALEIPIEIDGAIWVGQPMTQDQTDDGYCFHFRLTPESSSIPLFPGSDITLQRKVYTHVQPQPQNGMPKYSIRHVRISIFADEMPAIHAKMNIASVLFGWKPIPDSSETTTGRTWV